MILAPLVHITSHSSIESVGATLTGQSQSWGTNAWVAADRIIYVPILVLDTITTASLFWINGATISGNVSIGIFTAGGTLLVSGTAAHSGANVIQSVAAAITLKPDMYYIGMVVDNGTASFQSATGLTAAILRGLGLKQQASASLPSTATFAAVSSAYLPFVGLTTRSFI